MGSEISSLDPGLSPSAGRGGQFAVLSSTNRLFYGTLSSGSAVEVGVFTLSLAAVSIGLYVDFLWGSARQPCSGLIQWPGATENLHH